MRKSTEIDLGWVKDCWYEAVVVVVIVSRNNAVDILKLALKRNQDSKRHAFVLEKDSRGCIDLRKGHMLIT